MEQAPIPNPESRRRANRSETEPVATPELARDYSEETEAERAERLRQAQELLERELRFERDPQKQAEPEQATTAEPTQTSEPNEVIQSATGAPESKPHKTLADTAAVAKAVVPRTTRQLHIAYGVLAGLVLLILLILWLQS